MTLAAGTRLAGYEVLGPLGAGAMGEVYRAKDTRLGREVAIKVLPAHFADDEERLKRFEREAKTLASLNNPNVAQIFGVDQVGEVCFLVLELVEGESLEDRLKRGALPVDEALDVCRQIAEGLEAAHDAGVIHRDLKPANVRLTPDGKVKVLDFGLAKPMRDAKDPQTSTDSVLSTEQGRVLGTPTYMAPEQARGKPIDRRVDVWAFGCVLYECLTARRAFSGETLTDVFAAVLEREPDWSRLPGSTPPRVHEFLRHCLAKDPRQRLRDVGEMRILLADREGEAAAGPRRSRVLGVVLAGCVLLALDLGWRAFFRAAPAQAPPRPGLRLMSFTRLTDLPGAETGPDLSPDGNQLIYVSRSAGNADIWSLRVGGSRAVDLTAGCADDDLCPRFSPDGQSIVFASARDGNGLFVMGATGESVRRLSDGGFDPCWSPDGTRVAFADEPVDDPYSRAGDSELWIVDVANGALHKRLLGDAVQPAWSPDGRWIAYWSNTGGQRDIQLVGAAAGDPIAITHDAPTDWSPEWSPDGSRLFFASDRGGSMNLWSVGIDAASGHPTDEPRPETNGVRSVALARFSRSGRRMVCMAYDRTRDIAVHALDAGAGTLTLLKDHRGQSVTVSSVSPDGQWLVGSTLGPREDLVLLRADGSELRKLTDDAAKDREGMVSPDGTMIAFNSTRSGSWQAWSIRFDGSALTQLSDAVRIGDSGAWIADGSAVAFAFDRGGGWSLALADPHRLNPPASWPSWPLPPPLEDIACVASGPEKGSLTVALIAPDAAITQVGLLSLDPIRFEPFDIAPSGGSDGSVAGWLPDLQRVVLRGAQGIVLYDRRSKSSRILAPCGRDDHLALSRDGRVLAVVREVYDADIWLAELD